MDRQPVLFITTDEDDALSVAFAVPFEQPDETVCLRLHRRADAATVDGSGGVHVLHDLYPESGLELAVSIVLDDESARIESTARTYLLDLSAVDPADRAAARETLLRMHEHGEFELVLG